MKKYFANELSNISGLDEDVRDKLFPEENSNVDGGDGGDEDITEYENEESEIGGVPDSDLPRFRDLVRAKKVELKAQYGKGHFKNESYTTRECKNVPYPCPTFNQPLKVCKKEVCINIPKIRIVWVSGWRKKWREFKQSGGLAQLKQQSKGNYYTPSTTPPPISNPVVGIKNIANAELIGSDKLINPFQKNIDERTVEQKPKLQTEQNPFENSNQNEQVSEQEFNENSTEASENKQNKFLGMPMGVGIGVTLTGVVIIGFLSWKFLKK